MATTCKLSVEARGGMRYGYRYDEALLALVHFHEMSTTLGGGEKCSVSRGKKSDE